MLLVSSKKRPADFSNGMPGFMMARNKQATFGFVELRVVSPILTANCVVKNAEIAKVDPSELQQQLTKIRLRRFLLMLLRSWLEDLI